MRARTGGGEPQRDRRAAHGVDERQRHLRLDVGAAPGGPTGAGPRAAEQPAEHVAEAAGRPAAGPGEQVAQVEARDPAAGVRPRPEAPAGAEQAARLVVLPALGVVGQDVVGLGDLLEPLLAAGVLVRVQVAGQLAVGLLDVGRRGVLGDAEGRVVVLLRRSRERSSASPPLLSVSVADVGRCGLRLDSAGARLGHRHPGRAQDAPAARAGSPAGAPARTSATLALGVGLGLHERLVHRRVERLAGLAVLLEAELGGDLPRAPRRPRRTRR